MFPIEIYQIQYRDEAEPSEGGGAKYRISNLRPEWRELQALLDFFKSGNAQPEGFWGLVSQKFELKTHITIDKFRTFVAQNKQMDVCFINPFPQLSYWSYNVWMQGECAHPGLIEAAQMLIDSVGLNLNIKDVSRHGPDKLCYSNFWVGNAQFWEAYVGGWLMPIGEFLVKNPKHRSALRVMEPTTHTDSAPLLPFIIERLFSTFLSEHTNVKAASWGFSRANIIEDYCLNDFERLLVIEMAEEVEWADHCESFCFDAALRDKMLLMTKLFQRHFFDFYENRPHPHTGRVIKLGC